MGSITGNSHVTPRPPVVDPNPGHEIVVLTEEINGQRFVVVDTWSEVPELQAAKRRVAAVQEDEELVFRLVDEQGNIITQITETDGHGQTTLYGVEFVPSPWDYGPWKIVLTEVQAEGSSLAV